MRYDADPDPSFYLIRIRLNTLMRIRILLLISKVMQICDHWYLEPSGVHSEPSRHHRERPRPN
jgi:hypothetical protein